MTQNPRHPHVTEALRRRRFISLLSLPGLGLLPASAITMPVQFIRLSNDDGWYQPDISAASAKGWVDGMNLVYANNTTNLTFSYNPLTDFTTLRNTVLNDYDGSQISSKELLNEACRQIPGKMCLVARGNSGGGFTSTTCDFVSLPGYRNTGDGLWGQNYGLLQHELGHHFGLGHVFSHFYETKAEAEADLAANGNKPKFWQHEFSDISPFPLIAAYNPFGPASENLNGSVFTNYNRNTGSRPDPVPDRRREPRRGAGRLLADHAADGRSCPLDRPQPNRPQPHRESAGDRQERRFRMVSLRGGFAAPLEHHCHHHPGDPPPAAEPSGGRGQDGGLPGDGDGQRLP